MKRASRTTRRVIGYHAVKEVFKVRPGSIELFQLTPQAKGDAEVRRLLELCKARHIKVEERPKEFMDRSGSGHQGLAVESSEGPELDWDALKEPGPQVLIALDEVEDPHNLGAVMRSAWLLGAKGVLVPEMRSAHLTPTVFKVASGAGEHIAVSVEKNLPSTLTDLKNMGFWVFGLAGDGGTSLFKSQLNEKIAWVVGSESSGLRSSVRKVCDEICYIPQTDSTASLNAAVAAGLALAESYRQLLSSQ